MKPPIITMAIMLSLLAAPAAAQDSSGTSTGYDATTSPAFRTQQGLLPVGNRSDSYDNTHPATADPHLGPGDSDDGAAGIAMQVPATAERVQPAATLAKPAVAEAAPSDTG